MATNSSNAKNDPLSSMERGYCTENDLSLDAIVQELHPKCYSLPELTKIAYETAVADKPGFSKCVPESGGLNYCPKLEKDLFRTKKKH